MDMEVQNESFQKLMEYYQELKECYHQESLVALLRETQEIYDCIPLDIQEVISDTFQIKPVVISSLIKIYPSLKSAPYRHRITLCTGSQCSSRKSMQVLDAVRKELGIGKNQTKDNRFTLVTQNCLRRCKSGPNMRIDKDDYSFVKPEDIPSILKKYQ